MRGTIIIPKAQDTRLQLLLHDMTWCGEQLASPIMIPLAQGWAIVLTGGPVNEIWQAIDGSKGTALVKLLRPAP